MGYTHAALGRAAEAHDFVVRAISGHATVAMQERYSSVAGEEVKAGGACQGDLPGWLHPGAAGRKW
jgi:hypothetical protein